MMRRGSAKPSPLIPSLPQSLGISEVIHSGDECCGVAERTQGTQSMSRSVSSWDADQEPGEGALRRGWCSCRAGAGLVDSGASDLEVSSFWGASDSPECLTRTTGAWCPPQVILTWGP
jgi:hypothetical protein